MEVVFKPIGVVHTGAGDDEVKGSYFGVDGLIEVYPDYEDGLDGIDGFSHIIVIAFLHKVSSGQRRVLRVRHRGLRRLGINVDDLPLVGVFCTDSPHRPNPIALSILELVRRDGRNLYVRGLDLFDGTPILDIKAYTPGRCVEEIRTPEWHREISRRVEEAFGKVGRV
jgi:tRNA-Thr(GGU) m(6)t(6)A37 methyltransferase TsaA